ncbi:hypothetical protein VTK56DRAFT_6110 [Thermocarpiscus australiensis]
METCEANQRSRCARHRTIDELDLSIFPRRFSRGSRKELERREEAFLVKEVKAGLLVRYAWGGTGCYWRLMYCKSARGDRRCRLAGGRLVARYLQQSVSRAVRRDAGAKDVTGVWVRFPGRGGSQRAGESKSQGRTADAMLRLASALFGERDVYISLP